MRGFRSRIKEVEGEGGDQAGWTRLVLEGLGGGDFSGFGGESEK
jgi:hypothetical protein